MPLPTLITWLTTDDYDAVKRLAPNDADLPETYSEWLKLQSDGISNFEKYGRAYKKVTIHSDGLAQYCEASGMPCDYVGRDAYTVFVNGRVTESGG